MIKETSIDNERVAASRGWDALEIKLKEKGLSGPEIQEAQKSFYEGIETLTKMFLSSYDMEKRNV